MKIKFNNCYGEMELETQIRSIFDTVTAGQIAEDGKYYIILIDYKTKELYAIAKETKKQADALGYPLEEGQEAVFNGEKVRGMTPEEEERYNMDMLYANVDLWGNIEA